MCWLQPNSGQVRFAPSIKAGSDLGHKNRNGGDSREPPPVGIVGSKVYLLAVAAGAVGATGAAGA